ncbi:aminoglycoside phosphotransferase family protein [Dactylosporangium sp. NPDC000244]|uniref:phosphotransferase family protein n=1 Tax=Dactylosporangium sp. NPDC000244 TaxID=3154365 RepID=UPI00332293DB
MESIHISDESLAAIAALHGRPVEAVRPIASGVANHAFLLGDDLVLRIPRSDDFVEDLAKEAVVIPVARGLGVRTPAVVSFTRGRAEAGVPFLVLERVIGIDLEQRDASSAAAGRAYADVGGQLAALHRLRPGDAPDLAALPVEDASPSPWELVPELAAAGSIDRDSARWLTDWFTRLSQHVPSDPGQVLVHGDIAPQNLIVDPRTGELAGIVDWGDAMWADPAAEFAKIPLSEIGPMVEAYRAAAEPADGAWEARLLWYHLHWALGRLRDPAPRPGRRHWSAPPASRMLHLLRFLAGSPPAPWSRLR